MTTTEIESADNLPALPEPETVDLMAPLGLPSASEWGALGGMAEQLSRSSLVPKALRGRPDDVMLVLLVGRDLRLSPTQALFKIHIIEGKPTTSAELMSALVNRQPSMSIWPDDANDATKATARGARDGREMHATFDWADAQRAGLAGKDTWKKYPKAMLWARAVSSLCREAFSDVLCGVTYTPEELGAEVNPETGEVVSLAPSSTPPPESPFLSEANVKAVTEKATASGLYPEEIEEMVELATEGRTINVAEVRKDEVAALRDAMQETVERSKARHAKPDDAPSDPEPKPDYSNLSVGTCICPSYYAKEDRYLGELCPLHGEAAQIATEEDAWWVGIAPRVRALVDPNLTAKPTAAQYRSLVTGLKALGVEEGDDQRRVLSILLGRTVHSRKTLTASECAAVVAVLDEEGAG